MAWRMVKAVLILPGTAAVLVPGLITWAAAGTDFGGPVSPPGDIRFWAGLGIFGLGVCFGFWTASLFVTIGKGTPAPWDPPKKLVVRGPYRHVRNPMITSVLFMLLGEALFLQSWLIGGWGLFFFAANSVYFPLSEEKGLERRFGEDYLVYKANVPRWIPRLIAWRPPGWAVSGLRPGETVVNRNLENPAGKGAGPLGEGPGGSDRDKMGEKEI